MHSYQEGRKRGAMRSFILWSLLVGVASSAFAQSPQSQPISEAGEAPGQAEESPSTQAPDEDRFVLSLRAANQFNKTESGTQSAVFIGGSLQGKLSDNWWLELSLDRNKKTSSIDGIFGTMTRTEVSTPLSFSALRFPYPELSPSPYFVFGAGILFEDHRGTTGTVCCGPYEDRHLSFFPTSGVGVRFQLHHIMLSLDLRYAFLRFYPARWQDTNTEPFLVSDGLRLVSTLGVSF